MIELLDFKVIKDQRGKYYTGINSNSAWLNTVTSAKMFEKKKHILLEITDPEYESMFLKGKSPFIIEDVVITFYKKMEDETD
jgi:hypothetical protein